MAATIANAYRGKGRPFSSQDFMYEDAETAAMKQVEQFFGRFDRMKEAGKVG